MKLNTLLTSAMVAGFLFGAAEVKAVEAPQFHTVTVKNTSEQVGKDNAYTLQILYYDYHNSDVVKDPVFVKAGGTSPVLKVAPNKEIRIDRIIPGSTRTPNIFNTPEVVSNMNLDCNGTSEAAKCSEADEAMKK